MHNKIKDQGLIPVPKCLPVTRLYALLSLVHAGSVTEAIPGHILFYFLLQSLFVLQGCFVKLFCIIYSLSNVFGGGGSVP